MGSAVRLVLLDHEDILQLVSHWSSAVPGSVPGINLVHGADIREEVPRVQGVSAEGWQIPTKATRRPAGRLQ